MQVVSSTAASVPQFSNVGGDDVGGDDEDSFDSALAGQWSPTSTTDTSTTDTTVLTEAGGPGPSAFGATTASTTATSDTAPDASAGPISDASQPEDSVNSAIDDSQYSSPDDLEKWAPLVAGLPPDQQEAAEKALNRPIAVAKMLAAGGDDAKAAQAYLDANPAMKAALDTAAHGGKADGDISRNDISAFISKMEKQLGAANKTLSNYQKDNPDADGQSLELVREAALLQANLPLTNAADPANQGAGATASKFTSQAGLKAIANANPGLSVALQGAANTFSQPGMFAVLDQGGKSGVDLATHNADGLYDEKNITKWVKTQAPTTGGSFASLIRDAATRNAVAGVDTSKLNADVFANPQNYTGAQKAAVLVQLQTTQGQVEAGDSLRKISDTDAALQQRIAQLQADPDVTTYLQQSVAENESAITSSNPSLAAVVEKRYTDVVTGAGLQNDLDAIERNNANPKNRKESDAAALNDFSAELALQGDLHGGDVPSEAQIVASSSSLTTELESAYKDDFSNGGDLKQLLAQKGVKPTDALAAMQADEQTFEQVLDPNFIQSQIDQYSSTAASLLDPELVKSGSGKDVLAGLANGPAGLDDIAASVAESLSGQGQSPFSQSDTETLVRSFLRDLDGGTSLQDALAKYDSTAKSFDPSAAGPGFSVDLQADPSSAAKAHKLLESLAASALVMKSQAGGGATGEASGGASSEEGLVKSSYGLMGGELAAAAGAIYFGTKGAAGAAMATRLGLARDVLGGVGGIISAAFLLPEFKNLVNAGKGWDATLALAAGTRGAIAGATTAYDLARFAATGTYRSAGISRALASGIGRFAGMIGGEGTGLAAAETIGSALGPVGWVIDGVLTVAFIFTAIAEAVQKAHDKKAFDKTVDPTLDQYGIPKPH